MAKTDVPNGSFPAQRFGERRRRMFKDLPPTNLTPVELQSLADKVLQVGHTPPYFAEPPEDDVEVEEQVRSAESA